MTEIRIWSVSVFSLLQDSGPLLDVAIHPAQDLHSGAPKTQCLERIFGFCGSREAPLGRRTSILALLAVGFPSGRDLLDSNTRSLCLFRAPRTLAWCSKPSGLSDMWDDSLSEAVASGDVGGLELMLTKSGVEEPSIIADSVVCVPGLVVPMLAARNGRWALGIDSPGVSDMAAFSHACQ